LKEEGPVYDNSEVVGSPENHTPRDIESWLEVDVSVKVRWEIVCPGRNALL
jgi:hypothetical protein